LLDTNVISELVKPKPDSRVVKWMTEADESLLFFSVVTLGEIRKGITSNPNAIRRAQIENWFRSLVDRFAARILPVDLAICNRWGHLAGSCTLKGSTLPVIDGLLAATALHHDLIFVTRNIKDVQSTGVEVLNPWSL
jgi:toxin FitB